MVASPLDPHAASPLELQDRLRAGDAGAPFLVLRDGDDRQRIVPLDPQHERLTIGRGAEVDVPVTWDVRVSRVHAELVRTGGEWTVADEGLSRNGTWVNGDRVAGRRRLADGDLLLLGGTTVAFCAPASPTPPTATADGRPAGEVLTPAQRRVLVALCRPFATGPYATPASNADVARELTVSVDAVKTTMRGLFAAFGIEDLPQNRKRASLVQQAFRTGAVTVRDLGS